MLVRFAWIALFLLPTAGAAAVEIVAHDDGGHGGWFTLGDGAIQGPTLSFPPGETIEVRFRNEGTMPHNLHFGPPLRGVTRLIDPGADATLMIDVPTNATGEAAYWCDPHRQLGMSGKIRFEAPPPSTPPPSPTPTTTQAEAGNAVPWNAIVATLGAGMLAATLRRRDRQG